MSTHSQFGFGYGTAAQIASYIGLLYEPVYDSTNLRVVIMLGSGPGNMIPLATEAFVQAQVATLAAGNFQNQFLFSNTTYP